MPAIISAEKFRRRLRQPGMGEPFRYFEAVPRYDQNEPLYSEVTLPSGARVAVNDRPLSLQETEWGQFPAGSVPFHMMPDEVSLTQWGRIVLTATARNMIGLPKLIKGVDSLVQGYVTQVLWVRQGATVYALNTDYTVSGNTIVWVSGHGPDDGESYTAKIKYQPVFEYREGNVLMTRPDSYGVAMPFLDVPMSLWVPA